MESLPLIAKSNIVPNSDVTHVIREIFQTEFAAHVPSKKLSQNLRKSLEYERAKEDLEGEKTFRSVDYLENLPKEKGKLIEYAENVLKAYSRHEEALDRISKVELNIMETQAAYLNRERMLKENAFMRDLLTLKRYPLMKSYNPDYVKEFRLLQGDCGLPSKHEVEADFRLKAFKKWRKRLSSPEHTSLALTNSNTVAARVEPKATYKKAESIKKRATRPKKTKVPESKVFQTFRADPPEVCFTDYLPGKTYESRIKVRNVHTKPLKFLLKSPPAESSFKVRVYGTETSRILPGLWFKLLVTFEPRSLDEEVEAATIVIDDGSALTIPLISILEPPLLKTGADVDELTRSNSEKIKSSYIDCGACFPGDSKVTKLRFYSFGGPGEFFIMSLDNWINWHVDCLTTDNFTELPPFRFYPTYFQLDKGQFMDLYVEFKPPTSGMHTDNIVIACDNGEVRNLDIIGDGMGWNRSFIVFQDSLEKDYAPHISDESHVLYYLDLGSIKSTGVARKSFSVSNVSKMPFDFRWEMRSIVISFGGQEDPGKISWTELKIEPSEGVFQPYTTRTFEVIVNFSRRDVGQYRVVLSLYVIGLPYQSIEQASAIIRPSVLRDQFKSGSVFGEDDNNCLISPEHSRQDTYESIQEAMKSFENKALQFSANVCSKHPEICAMPLKKSTTHSNIGDVCTCSAIRSLEFRLNSCDSYQRKPNLTDLGSDLLWDFVDVLVDELEVWVEVRPIIVDLEPVILNLGDDIIANKPPIIYEVFVNNRSEFPITCKWLKPAGKEKTSSNSSKDEINTIFTIEGRQKQSSSDEEVESYIRNFYVTDEGDWEQSLGSYSTFMDTASEYQIMCFAGHGYPAEGNRSSANRFSEISVEPGTVFTVQPKTRFKCLVKVSASEPGIISRTLNLSVESGTQTLPLYVIGKVPDREISVYPRMLDFSSRKRGARYEKHFKIRNESDDFIEWSVEQYKYDYSERTMVGPLDKEKQSNLKNLKGVLEGGECTIENYKLDARKPGLQTFILKFKPCRSAYMNPRSRYMIVVGDVQTPKLTIQAPRFENAILAPSRTMYVGQMITQTIILKNMKSVVTNFIWGNPFGCHCKKLRINMCPKFCVVGGMRKIAVQVNITPLEEGIVEHCYVPCFFSRNVDPTLLSIVGVVKDLQITFEVTEEKTRICDGGDVGGVFRISWPIKNFDPCVGLSNIMESRILDFECHCDEIDAEYLKQMKAEMQVTEIVEGEVNIPFEDAEGLFLPEAEELDRSPCERKYYTPSTMRTLKKAILKNKLGFSCEEEEEWGDDGETTNDDCREQADAYMGKDTNSIRTVAECPKRECINLFYYAASEIHFFNVPHKTVAVKTFQIKNESPISTTFSMRVRYFAKSTSGLPSDRLLKIKNRVFGRERGEFEDGLMYGQPLLITTSPSEGVLNGWSSVTVSVLVYGDTWGEYRDFIICDVGGIPPFFLKVFVRLSGHPVLFPMFRSSIVDVPVLRFNTIKYKAGSVQRSIRVCNTSSIPITVTWLVFLTCPLEKRQKEDPFNLCLDFYSVRDSEDPEKATKSSRNYLSKNTSGSLPTMALMGADGSASRLTGTYLEEDESGKNNSPFRQRYNGSSPSGTSDADPTKPEIQLLEYFGKADVHFFQLCPRELDLEPYSEQKISITFDPSRHEQTVCVQGFEAVATGCVRLKQEHAHFPDIYHRPNGKDYISKLLVMSAAVERPILHFDFTQGELKYVLNANDVLRSANKTLKITKKYLAKNKCETEIVCHLKVKPGVVFSVKMIETQRRVYTTFEQVTVDPGTSMEIHLEATLTVDQVTEMHRNQSGGKPDSNSSDRVSDEFANQESSGSDYETSATNKEIIQNGDTDNVSDSDTEVEDFSVKLTDSLNLRMQQWRSADSSRSYVKDFQREVQPEEYLEQSGEDGATGVPHIVREEVIFQQELTKQTITPVLHLFFPRLRINPGVVDFGKVCLGETARRYASVTNMTQFPTVMRVLMTDEEEQIAVRPREAYLPARNSGAELTVEFKPNAPGHFQKVYRIFGNREMAFDPFLLTVVGFGTWNEKYKYRSPDQRYSSELFST